MRDELSSAHSALIQNQIELTSTPQSFIDEAASRGVSATHITDLRRRMESFDSQLNALSKRLLERYDSLGNEQIDQDQLATTSI